jgi:hypothetical protein
MEIESTINRSPPNGVRLPISGFVISLSVAIPGSFGIRRGWPVVYPDTGSRAKRRRHLTPIRSCRAIRRWFSACSYGLRFPMFLNWTDLGGLISRAWRQLAYASQKIECDALFADGQYVALGCFVTRDHAPILISDRNDLRCLG